MRIRSRLHPHIHPRWRPTLLTLGLTLCLGVFQVMQAAPALACGGLVAADGDVRLGRAATLIAWHNGVERYLTSFTYEGDVKNLGWIVPLPAVPLKIEPGGRWTLQRLARETQPQLLLGEADQAFGAAAPSAAQVLQQVTIEALNITVLRGSGQAVLDWCTQNGFSVAGDTRDHLLKYAQGSPIFMAAKYDTTAAQARHQQTGDGAPVLITMRTPHPWVPLEVLALDGQIVHADLYFLTDDPLNTSALAAAAGQTAVGTEVGGAQGFRVAFQERMNPSLYHDLSTDRNMSWVRSDSWLTYVALDAPAETVTYDLSVTPDGIMSLTHFGVAPTARTQSASALPGWLPRLPIGAPEVLLLLLLAAALGGAGYALVQRGRRVRAF